MINNHFQSTLSSEPQHNKVQCFHFTLWKHTILGHLWVGNLKVFDPYVKMFSTTILFLKGNLWPVFFDGPNNFANSLQLVSHQPEKMFFATLSGCSSKISPSLCLHCYFLSHFRFFCTKCFNNDLTGQSIHRTWTYINTNKIPSSRYRTTQIVGVSKYCLEEGKWWVLNTISQVTNNVILPFSEKVKNNVWNTGFLNVG